MQKRHLAFAIMAGLTLAACNDPVRPASRRPSRPALGLGLNLPLVVTVTTTDLGVLGVDQNGLEMSRARAINDSGVVTGATTIAGGTTTRVFRWRTSTGMQPTSVPGEGFDINFGGTIVGQRRAGHTALAAEGFILSPQGALTQLGVLPGGTSSDAVGVTDNGSVVGNSYGPASPGSAPFIWHLANQTLVPYPAADRILNVAAVNSVREIVGERRPTQNLSAPSGVLRILAGVDWIDGGPREHVYPTDLNAKDLVVGWSRNDLAPGPTTNFAWSWTLGTSQTQPLQSNGQGAAAFGINRNNYIVGAGENVSAPAFWTPAGQYVPLPRLTPGQLGCPVGVPDDMACRADDVNSTLQIVGADVAPNGSIHAVLWQVKYTLFTNVVLGPLPITLTLPTKATLTVALLGSSTLDVRAIPFDGLTLGDDAGRETRVARYAGRPYVHFEDFDGDGDMDLVAHFAVEDLLRNGDLTPATTSLVLNADLGDGTYVRGVGSVRTGLLPGR